MMVATGIRCIAAFAMAVGWGCGGALPAGDAGPDGPEVSDSGLDDVTLADVTLADVTPADGTTPADGAGDASAETGADAKTCPSVAQVCADATSATPFGCGTTWSTAQQPSTWCRKAGPNAFVLTAPHCDGFDIAVLSYVDTATNNYYDLQTGALVGIEYRYSTGTGCIAGQAPDVPIFADCYDAASGSGISCAADGSLAD
jgi:hypothetical protein